MKTIRMAVGILCESVPDAANDVPQHGVTIDYDQPRNAVDGVDAAGADGAASGAAAADDAGAADESAERSERVLAVRRGLDGAEGLWEFPASKVERGETPAEACKRVLAEELGVRVSDLRDIYTIEYDCPGHHLSMECFACRVEDGEPQKGDRQLEMRWVDRHELSTLEWVPADVELVRALSEAPGEQAIAALAKRRRDSRHSMQGNKRQDTKPELLVRQRLREAGLTGYRLQWKKAPGRPDIAFPGRKIAIFVNGCFWHRCPHCNPSVPKRNVEFWKAKFRRNVERDKRAISELEALGWTPITIWECELKCDKIDETMARVIEQVQAADARKKRASGADREEERARR